MYEPTKGSSYIPLPVELRNSRKGLVNLKNEDNECFRWCHIRYLNPQEKDAQRIKKTDRKMVEELNYQGVEFPIATKHYGKIEEQNSINVNDFGYEDKRFYPIYVSKQNNEKVLNLLLITEGEKKYYVLIKYFNRMMFHKTKHEHRKHFCMHCLQCFSAEEVLSKHKMGNKPLECLERVIIYSIFRTILSRCLRPLSCPPILRLLQRKYLDVSLIALNLIPISIKSTLIAVTGTKLYAVVKINIQNQCKFTEGRILLRSLCHRSFFRSTILPENYKYHFNKPLQMTDVEEQKFKVAKVCHICGHQYTWYKERDIRGRDHCHITGQYRGSAH